MYTKSMLQPRRFGLRFLSCARALPAVLLLAALAVPARSFAAAPTFNAFVTTPTNSSFYHPQSAAVGDFNGDGKLDSIVVDGSNTLRVMLGNGDGTFTEHDLSIPSFGTANSSVVGLPQSLASYSPGPIDGFTAIQAVDVNHNGKLGVVCIMGAHINFGPFSFVTVLANTGNNDANGVPIFTVTSYYCVFAGLRSITVGDLNGDGYPDYIVGNSGGSIQVLMNNTGGMFAWGSYFSVLPVS